MLRLPSLFIILLENFIDVKETADSSYRTKKAARHRRAAFVQIIYSQYFNIILYYLHTLLEAEPAGIQTQVVIAHVVPVLAGVRLVVRRTLLVGALYLLSASRPLRPHTMLAFFMQVGISAHMNTFITSALSFRTKSAQRPTIMQLPLSARDFITLA